ncbi:aldose 1-epimerase [Beduinella massiliensis]|uniref:aldose epimerase family protein n=1 Tax=Beduinella massiliensis TaxID=1852363 RepID=UPI000C853FBB
MKDTLLLTGFGYEAEICAQRGANLVALRKPELGMDVLRTPRTLDTFFQTNPYLWGIPILFPPNRISGACFEFERREYRFPMNEPEIGNFIHGVLHETALPCIRSSPTEAEFLFDADETHPYMTFPHAFQMRVLYRLTPDGIQQRISITNCSASNMPVALGFHTTFRLPFVSEGDVQDVRLCLGVEREYVRNMDTFLPTGEVLSEFPLRSALLEGTVVPANHTLSRHYDMDSSRRMILKDAAKQMQIVYQADESYRFWMVYNGGSKDFLCVEPQTWLNNCPNAPFDRKAMGFRFICPGQTLTYKTSISLQRM